jgi:hypothetical protein
MTDKDMPNRASNMEKAEGDRWTSDSETVERRDQDQTRSGAETEEVINRSGAGTRTPRRYDEPAGPEDKL